MRDNINLAIDIDGKEIEILSSKSTMFSGYMFITNTNMNLVKLTKIQNNVGHIICTNNLIEELILPIQMKRVRCDNNKLTKLILNYGLESLTCTNNSLTNLELPPYLKLIWCDKELFDYDKCNVKEVKIFY